MKATAFCAVAFFLYNVQWTETKLQNNLDGTDLHEPGTGIA